MTTRERNIIRALLDVLHDADGHQYSDTQLHQALNVRLVHCTHVPATLTEYAAAVGVADGRGWLTGIVSTTSGLRKWSINDQGQAARADL